MSEKNKAILQEANAAVAEGNYERFVSFCTDDTEWTFVGDKTLTGKDAVLQWMTAEYVEPPHNTVATMIAEGNVVVAIGAITTKGEDGKAVHASYCDIWRFRDGKMVTVQAFVVEAEVTDETDSAAYHAL